MIIPGILISIATFPGVILHEAAHHLFCRLRKVPVYNVRYFQFDLNVAGYVAHGAIDNFTSTFLIAAGPFFINTILCLIICFPASIPYYFFNDRSFMTYFLLWLGVSIGMHAFPSNTDARHIWQQAKEEVQKRNTLAIISFPFVVLVFIANLLRFFWFDALYGYSIGVLLPSYVLKHF